MQKLKWMLLPLSMLLFACSPSPPDVPVCGDLKQKLSKDPITNHLILTPNPVCEEKIAEIECGHCTYIVSGNEIYIGEDKKNWVDLGKGKKSWSQISDEAIRVPAESYEKIAEYMINSCEKTGCNADLNRFKVKIDSVLP